MGINHFECFIPWLDLKFTETQAEIEAKVKSKMAYLSLDLNLLTNFRMT